jgi:hypothetical protein
MSALPAKCGIGPGGHVVFGEGGVLDPGWKAAIAMLELEAKIAASEMQRLTDEGEIDSSNGVEVLSRIEACEVAVALLKVQGRQIGLDV